MARKLLLAGVNRWPPANDNLTIEQALTYQIDTCSFSIRGEQPAEGEEVIVEDDSIGRLFAGIIVKVELIDKDLKIWAVECDDYTALLDRRLVVESYENMSASDIFLDIVAKYCPGFTTNGVRPGAPVIESTGAEFEYKRPSECFRWLCDYVGWHWQPDYYKDLHFFSAEELASPAPMTLVPGGKFRFGKHSIDTQGLRNRVYVRGGTMLSDPQVIQWKADGVARIWTLPWGPHEVSLTVGEVPMTVGVENLHDEADFDYMMSFTEKYIRCSAQTSTPVEGITMALTARQDIPVITMVEDYASQAAIAKVQGRDGIYEHVISDDTLISIAAAEAAGMADLREHGNPRVKGSFETEYVPEPVTVEKKYEENMQADFQSGTLTDVVATSAGNLELAKKPGAVNLLSANQSSVETDITGLAANGSGTTISRDTTVSLFGNASLKVVTAAASGHGFLTNPYTAAVGGRTYTASLYIKGSGTVVLRLQERSGGTFLRQTQSVPIVLNDTWQRVSVTTTIGTDANQVLIYVANTTASANTYWADGLQIEENDFASPWTLGGTISPDSYEPIGTRIKEVNISGANPAGGTKIEWSATMPTGTSVKVETALSLDGGSTYGEWQEATNGGNIPGITVETDLSNAKLKIRQTLSTTDPTVTPQLHSMTLSWQTSEVRYWQPGQIVDIRLSDRGVEGEFLIQRVTITPTWSNPSIWTFRVEYGGRLLGIADFLKALVSAQQKKRVIEPTKNVQKYIYGEETLTVGDELITATRGLPFVCGDADAICGLVVVSNG